MRIKTLILAGSLLLSVTALSTQAATIVQNISGLNQSLGDSVPFDINADPFNASLGVLQDVTVELIGSYTPEIDADLVSTPPATTILTTHLFIEVPNSVSFPPTSVLLGTQSVPVVVSDSVAFLDGTTQPVDQIFDLAAGLAGFETATPGLQDLVQYGFLTSDSFAPGISSSGSDLTTFTGSAILTYTYQAAVPEPATMFIFALGLFSLAWSRRRS